MNAYIFQAALLCEPCGKATCDQLRKSIADLHPGFDEDNESTYDSDYYPKGPYPDGGGEADCPQHCDHCGVFLENPLTSDGYDYVRESAAGYGTAIEQVDESWEDTAQYAESNDKPALAQWIRFYLK
jgi:hypothetical protein